jgi:hypothetical protein
MGRFYKEPAKWFSCGMLLKIPLIHALDFFGNLSDSLISGVQPLWARPEESASKGALYLFLVQEF